LADNTMRVTVNRQFATLDTPVNDQHEIALLWRPSAP
jgi:molybdopterin converting factor small subunit